MKNGFLITFREILSSFTGNDAIMTAMKDFKITPICVEDPFLLNHNTTQNVNKDGLQRFQREARVAMNVCIKISAAQAPGKDCSNNTVKELFNPTKYIELLSKNLIILPAMNSFSYLNHTLTDGENLFNSVNEASKQYLSAIVGYFYVLKQLKLQLDVECIYNREILQYLHLSLKARNINDSVISLIIDEIETLFQCNNSNGDDSISDLGQDNRDISLSPPAKKVKVESEISASERKFPRLISYCKVKTDTWTGRRQKRRLQQRLNIDEACKEPGEAVLDDENVVDYTEKNDNRVKNPEKTVPFNFIVTVEASKESNTEIVVKFDLVESDSAQNFQSFYAYVKKFLQSNC